MLTNEQLEKIYNSANAINGGRNPPLTTERIFKAMRACYQQGREDIHILDNTLAKDGLLQAIKQLRGEQI
jgi:hypothetical protein